MRTEQPLAALQRRLRTQPDSDAADIDQDGDDDDEIAAPSWIPDGQPSRGMDVLAAIRADPGRAGGIALGVVALLAVLVTVFTLARSQPAAVASANLPSVEMVSSAAPHVSAAPQASTPATSKPAQQVVVSVVGLVRQPGLVTLAPDSRIADAVVAAGGALSGTDTLGLNLARHLTDGEQVVVGISMPAGKSPVLGSSVGGGPAGPAPASGGAKPVGPVDLNTATVEQLDALPGVGPVRAAAIVAWRTANGKFTSVDQLGEVEGIGPARLDKLRPLVRV
jgi:competence protein ComEA